MSYTSICTTLDSRLPELYPSLSEIPLSKIDLDTNLQVIAI